MLAEAITLGDRMHNRIPTPELNRFLSELVQERQPPAKQGHRLKLLYMAQIGTAPPRFAIQVNSRTRVTRDYAYFLENRLRVALRDGRRPARHRLQRARLRPPRAGRRTGRWPGGPGATLPLAAFSASSCPGRPSGRHRSRAPQETFPTRSLPPDLMTHLSDNEYLFTSESVTEGHPDKIADQISDGVLDAVLRDDPYGRVACETLVNTGLVVVSGEITTTTYVDIQDIARETIRKIGYTDADLGFSADSCAVINAIDKQSPDIAQGVDAAYEAAPRPGRRGCTRRRRRRRPGDDVRLRDATRRTSSCRCRSRSRTSSPSASPTCARPRSCPYLRPDGKTQVTVRYLDGKPVEIEKVLISTQHRDGVDPESLIKPDLFEHVLLPILPHDLFDEKKLLKNFLVNPTGRFVIGGPVGDCGLTGRKIIVDTYGGMARHGGGAFSGKDPSKVDRSAAYAARYVAKNVVAAGLADRAEVQVAYAIGVAHPVSVMVETFGTEKIGSGADPGARRRALRPAPGRVPRVPEASTGRSTRRPPPTATSAARTTTSRGSGPTRPTRCARPPASAPPARPSSRRSTRES